MINPEVAIPLAVALATPVAILYRWFQHRERLAELAAKPARVAEDQADRLERVERAIEAVAVEVERIGEGQRYLTGVVADRAIPGPVPAPVPRAKAD